MKFAYADPPYLGRGKRFYGKHHPDAADWDNPDTHTELITQLVTDYPDGWAVSLTTTTLKLYLTHCPDDIRVGAWCKPWHQWLPLTVQHAWEPIIWRGGRHQPQRKPMINDFVVVNGNRPQDQAFIGAKPQAFNRWILDILGYQDGDTLVDLFPGSGSMTDAINRDVLL